MAAIREKLISAGIVGLDTAIFIYHLESSEKYRDIAGAILATIEHGECHAVTSVLSLLELNVRPYQMKKSYVAREYEILLANFPNLEIVDITRDIARKAAQLRALYNVRTPDAIQLAACIERGANLFMTNDKNFLKVKHGIEIAILDDFLV
jgi:predicted nucleic acid-binding protein